MNNLIEWNPFHELSNFPSLLSNRLSELGRFGNSTWEPAFDISEDDESYAITADFPEVNKDDLKVSFENGHLTISGERHHESEDKNNKKKFHRIERSYGSCDRSFALPDNVDAENIRATFDKGVLNVSIPKIEGEETPDKIEISIN